MRRDSVWEILVAVCEDPVPPPLCAGPLAPLIGALLTKDPDARPDAVETAAALTDIRDESPSPAEDGAAAVRDGRPGHPPRPSASGPRPAAAPDTVSKAVRHPGSTPDRARRIRRTALAVIALALAAGGVYAALPGPRTTAAGPAEPIVSPPVDLTPTVSAAGLWIAQLSAIPRSADQSDRDKELLAIQRQVPGARVLDSNDWKSLQPGYWVIYTTAGFPNGESALSFCAQHGRSKCIGRFLSQDTADGRFVCLPTTDPGQPPSREACHRP
ncbi:hypothetical protein ACFC1T_36505 [Kitasatospora sp. NPDC056076]|uniref:hypothetical protein n=1 Tax=Kitasatospora sp. NPDC056076 TaxID=3345703 RepID=UPI0035DA04B3